MFTRKPKTVATVIQSFLNIIADLDQIVIDQIDLTAKLSDERIAINEKIEVADLEIHQARGISDRLTNLCGGDCAS